jgi:hypothetical protein
LFLTQVFAISGCQIYKAFLKPNVNKFVLLIATIPVVVSLAVVPFIRRFPSDGLDGSQSSVKQRFHFTYVSTHKSPCFTKFYESFIYIFNNTWHLLSFCNTNLHMQGAFLLLVFFLLVTVIVQVRPSLHHADSWFSNSSEFVGNLQWCTQKTKW